MDSKMEIYGVTLTESFSETFYVLAPSQEVANKMVEDAYYNDELIINSFDEWSTAQADVPDDAQMRIDLVFEEREEED